MNEAIEQIRSLLTKADQALNRQADRTRTPRQRDDDFDEALRAHRQAAAILGTLHGKPEIEESFVAALAPLQVEVADLEILISEIRFDEVERTERLPRLRHAG